MTEDRESHADGRLFVGLVLGGIVLFVLAVATGSALDATPGSLADWIAAVSTFAALLAASYAAVQTSRTFRLEQERDRKRDDVARQQQAGLVASWAIEVQFVHSTGGHQDPSLGVYGVAVEVRNVSALPVTAVRIEVTLVWAAGSTAAARALGEVLVPVLPPHEQPQEVFVVAADPQSHKIRPAGAKAHAEVALTFRDASGVLWNRQADGRLSEVPD